MMTKHNVADLVIVLKTLPTGDCHLFGPQSCVLRFSHCAHSWRTNGREKKNVSFQLRLSALGCAVLCDGITLYMYVLFFASCASRLHFS